MIAAGQAEQQQTGRRTPHYHQSGGKAGRKSPQESVEKSEPVFPDEQGIMKPSVKECCISFPALVLNVFNPTSSII